MAKSVVENYVFNLFYNLVNAIFPLLLFSYVSRILGPTSLGKVSYILSIVQYFVFLANLGLPLYGTREIAKVRLERDKTSKLFWELVAISFITTLISLVVYLIYLFFLKNISDYKSLYLIFVVNIILSVISIDWLYAGFEEYNVISFRNLVAKILSIILALIFIHNSNDYNMYALVLVISVNASYLLNIFFLRQKVDFVFKNLDLKQHIKPLVNLFFVAIGSVIIDNTGIVLLAHFTSSFFVGLFYTCQKIINFGTWITISLIVVLYPRASKIVSANKVDEFNALLDKTVNFIYFISIPIMCIIFVFTKQVIQLMAGEKFLEAWSALKIMLGIIFMNGICNVMISLILLPLNKEKKIVLTFLIGIGSIIILDYILIPKWGCNGAALAVFLTNFIMNFVLYRFSGLNFRQLFISKERLNYLIGGGLIVFFLLVVRLFIEYNLITALIFSAVSLVIYLAFLFLIKDEFLVLSKRKVYKFFGRQL